MRVSSSPSPLPNLHALHALSARLWPFRTRVDHLGVIFEMLQFIRLRQVNPETVFMAPPDLDKLMRRVVLDTALYRSVCGSIFVDYDPRAVFDRNAVEYKTTLHHYEREYGEPPSVAYWPQPVKKRLDFEKAPAASKKRPRDDEEEEPLIELRLYVDVLNSEDSEGYLTACDKETNYMQSCHVKKTTSLNDLQNIVGRTIGLDSIDFDLYHGSRYLPYGEEAHDIPGPVAKLVYSVEK